MLAHVQPQPQAQTAAHQPPATMDVLTAAAAALSTIQPQGAGYGHASAPAGRWQMEPQQQPQALPVESVPRAVSSTAPAERLEPGRRCGWREETKQAEPFLLQQGMG